MQTVGFFGIVSGTIVRFWPVWIALALMLVGVWRFKRRLAVSAPDDRRSRPQ